MKRKSRKVSCRKQTNARGLKAALAIAVLVIVVVLAVVGVHELKRERVVIADPPMQTARVVAEPTREDPKGAFVSRNWRTIAPPVPKVSRATDPLPPAPWRGETVYDRLQGIAVAESTERTAKDISDDDPGYESEYDEEEEEAEEREHVAFMRRLDE